MVFIIMFQRFKIMMGIIIYNHYLKKMEIKNPYESSCIEGKWF